MKSDADIIRHLNKVLYNELTAINQYFLHGKILKNRGLTALGERTVRESIDEMKHAGRLVERVLFLEGLPNMQDLGKLTIGETVTEMLEADLALEIRARGDLQAGIVCAEEKQDFVTRILFQEILNSEEEHIDWLETQLDLIHQIGFQNYLQTQMAT